MPRTRTTVLRTLALTLSAAVLATACGAGSRTAA